MSLKVEISECYNCGACASVCPVDVIEVMDRYVKVKEGCTECGLCADACPVGAIEVAGE